jgi:hypothetical protein
MSHISLMRWHFVKSRSVVTTIIVLDVTHIKQERSGVCVRMCVCTCVCVCVCVCAYMCVRVCILIVEIQSCGCVTMGLQASCAFERSVVLWYMHVCARLCSYVYKVFLCVPPVWGSALRWLCPSVWPAPVASAPPIPLSWGNNESTNQNHSNSFTSCNSSNPMMKWFYLSNHIDISELLFSGSLVPNKRQWTETGREILYCSVRNVFVFLLQNSLLQCAIINKTLKVQNDPIEIHVCQIE